MASKTASIMKLIVIRFKIWLLNLWKITMLLIGKSTITWLFSIAFCMFTTPGFHFTSSLGSRLRWNISELCACPGTQQGIEQLIFYGEGSLESIWFVCWLVSWFVYRGIEQLIFLVQVNDYCMHLLSTPGLFANRCLLCLSICFIDCCFWFLFLVENQHLSLCVTYTFSVT